MTAASIEPMAGEGHLPSGAMWDLRRENQKAFKSLEKEKAVLEQLG